MSDRFMCEVCGEPSRFKCSSCQAVHYCCKDHQKEDWKNHKSTCFSYKIVINDELGRHLVATRSIPEGTIILTERPLVVGPAQVTPPVCLGCYKLLQANSKKDCSKCGWPICSKVCEKSDAHVAECEVTARRGNGKIKIRTFIEGLPHPSYQCLTILRCLYLKNSKPHVWKKLINLQSHCEKRKTSPKYCADQLFIAKFIPEFLNYTEFSNEEIMRVAGIVQVNAHEVPLKNPGYVAIYEKASFLEHSCKANCIKSFTNSGNLVIRSSGNIAPGDHLSICYTDPLWGRRARICHLIETKFFLCRCPRCSDPTEIGTHFNSVRCTKNCGDYCIPMVGMNEVNFETGSYSETEGDQMWNCQKCNSVSLAETKLLLDIEQAVQQLDKTNVTACKAFLKKYEEVLHPNHHLMVRVKLALIDLMAWQDKLSAIDDEDLSWTIKTCREVHDLCSVLIPAENRLAGVILYQLQLALMESGRRKTKQSRTSSAELKHNLLECRDVLTKAHRYLNYEPNELPEGKMAVEAKRALENLNKIIQ
ncbi:hypothetical protein RUM44_005404 [Polyplax serrata]|uniref:Protein msta n=1 Tax=Polyplax serrata TaxID=468196 RepID=A0ABR1ADG0_POLSC